MRKTVAYPIVGVLVISAVGAFIWTCHRSVDVAKALAAYAQGPDCRVVNIVYPRDGTLFPPESVPPTVRWDDGHSKTSQWLVHVEVADGGSPIDCLSHERQWTPTPQDWARIKAGSRDKDARILVLGVRSGLHTQVVSAAAVTVRTSHDEVGAPLFYREVNLPFIDAMAKIDEQFLNDYSFVRAGNEFYRHLDADRAIGEYRKALELNPNSVDAHQRLGFLLGRVKDRPQEGMAHLRRTLALQPHNVRATGN